MSVLPFKSPKMQPKVPPQVPPMFNVPPLTWYTLVFVAVVQAFMSFGPIELVREWGYRLAFVPARFTNASLFDMGVLVTPITHIFLHGGWFHVVMNGVMLMAFGAAAERTLGAKKTAVLFLLCGIAGAATQFAINPFTPIPMVGASGALSGLFAAVIMRLQASGQMPRGKWGIWSIGALWIGISFVTALIGGAIGVGDVAWAAHAGGFLAGVFLTRLRYFS